MTKIRVAGIEEESIVDGPGIRFVVFAQGCLHHCIGCHNPESHSLDGGVVMEIDEIINQIKSNSLLDGITISGGEPFLQAKESSILAKKAKELGLTVITYTGYTIEEILKIQNINLDFKELLINTDILVDGKFDISKKSLLLKFKGSSNQRIIDVPKTLQENQIKLLNL